MATPAKHKPIQSAADGTDLEVRYSPNACREQRSKALNFGFFGIVTSIAGFAYGAYEMLHHRQVDIGADLYRHLWVPAWVLMLLCVLWGAASLWAMRRMLLQYSYSAPKQNDSPTDQP